MLAGSAGQRVPSCWWVDRSQLNLGTEWTTTPSYGDRSEVEMRRYVLVSGAFLALLASVQLLRIIMQWPVRVATVDVPVWASGVAALIAGSLAIWAFRVAARAGSPPPV